MRKKGQYLTVTKRTVFVPMDRREREVINTAGTVNGEGESQKPLIWLRFYFQSSLNRKRGQYAKYINEESENKQG